MAQRHNSAKLVQNNVQHEQLSRDLDLQYLFLRQQIADSPFHQLATKHVRIRLSSWLTRLDQIISNVTWKRNRNNYAKIINLMCDCEVVVSPFLSLAPEGDIPKLNKHEINQIIDNVERTVKEDINRLGQNLLSSKESNQMVKPEEHWSKVKSLRQNSKVSSSVGEESLYLGRFLDIANKSNGHTLVKDSLYFLDQSKAKIIQEPKPLKNKIKILKQNNKQNNVLSQISIRENIPEKQKAKQNKSILKTPPKHISIELNTKTIPQQSQSHQNMVELSSFSRFPDGQSNNPSCSPLTLLAAMNQLDPPQAFRDTHQSFSYQNRTLKTEMIDNEFSINQQPQSEYFNQSHDSVFECNFDEQISERIRYRDEVLNHNYFDWKDNLHSNQKRPIKLQIKINNICSKPTSQFAKSHSISSLEQHQRTSNALQGIDVHKQKSQPDCQVYEGVQMISLSSSGRKSETLRLKDITLAAINSN